VILFNAIVFPLTNSLLGPGPDTLPDKFDKAVAALLVGECARPPMVKNTAELPQVVVIKTVAHVVCDEAAIARTSLLNLLLVVPLGKKPEQEIISHLKLSNLLVVINGI
jgi:hypothetical protein